MMRPEAVGIFACLGGYAVTGSAPAMPQMLRPPVSLRPSAPLGSAAAAWRARRLLEAAQMDWQEAQEIAAQAPDSEIEEWQIAQMLDEMRVSPPLATMPVQISVSGVRQGEPHRVGMADFIPDMINPESLELAPAIAEYDVTYEWELENDPWPLLRADEVDLELFNV